MCVIAALTAIGSAIGGTTAAGATAAATTAASASAAATGLSAVGTALGVAGNSRSTCAGGTSSLISWMRTSSICSLMEADMRGSFSELC